MKDIYERINVNGETWYSCGSLKSKYWAEKHAQPIKKSGGKYAIIKTEDGDFQVFSNKKKFARMGTIFDTKNKFPKVCGCKK